MIPEAHAASGELNPQLAVVGLLLEHRLDLSEGLRVPVKLQKHAGVFSARGSIVRCPLEHGRQQDLRIIEYAPGNADARQEPHGLHMIAVREQVGAHPRLGAVEIAVGEQRHAGQHLRRELRQARDAARRLLGWLGLTGHAKEALEHAPAADQRVIERHRLEKGLDGRGRLLQVDAAPAAFLVQPAEARMVSFESRQRAECLVRAAEMALRDGHG